ncbi:MAG: extracellular solute-binding protein [Candidatus Izemoplasmataceae bacterium]
MKRFFMLLVSFTFVFVLSACLTGGTGRGEVVVDIPDEIPADMEIELVLWTAFGQANSELIDEMFESFQAMYPNITLTQTGQGNYNNLRESMIHAIAAGATPTMMFGYPDHFAGYINGNALVPLNDYIDHEIHGVDLDDYVQGFIAENAQFGGTLFSMPFAKSTEMVAYNKTVFDHHGIDLMNRTTAVTWDELDQWAELIVGDGPMQCEFLFNADSSSNFFINTSRQWGAGYTNVEGEILVDNQQTRDMLGYFQARFANNTVVFPIEWDQDYGSNNFIAGDVCMTQGSTAGTRYNVPTPGNTQNSKFGVFELGIIPVVQKEACPLDPEATNIPANCSAMQQGPNIAVSSDANDYERLAAWLFIKHMTTPENTRFFAQNTGYVPVRISAFESTEYQAFLNTTDPDELPFAMAGRAAYQQVNFYRFDPAFTGNVTSARARLEAGQLFEAIYNGENINDRLQVMINRLS